MNEGESELIGFTTSVMAGLDPAIQAAALDAVSRCGSRFRLSADRLGLDGRIKPGHDEGEGALTINNRLIFNDIQPQRQVFPLTKLDKT